MTVPQLTPAKLFNGKKLPADWEEAKAAFICFTPFPAGFEKYVIQVSTERFFLHSPCSEVRLCTYNNSSFIILSEVYGFEVGSTTVEELIYYGIKNIIGIGYVGAFNGAPIGQRFIAKSALSDLPLARHYGVEANEAIYPSTKFYALIKNLGQSDGTDWEEYSVWCTNSLYREYPATIQEMKERNCSVVNMDTISPYSVAALCARETGSEINYIYVGTVTDSHSYDGESWQTDLIETITTDTKQPHDELSEYMVEKVFTAIAQS